MNFTKSSLTPRELQRISQETLRHYDQQAIQFWEGTKDHDVTQNYQALLGFLPPKARLKILDLGCGPGRDLLYFKSLGHDAIGLDGSPQFCRMARVYSSCEVLEQDFLSLDLPPASFDGIFANASLFHIPSQELPRVLHELWMALKPKGVLFSSNPRGSFEGWQGDRYGNFMEFEAFQKQLEEAGFEAIHHYYRPTGKPCWEQPWLAVVSRKVNKTANTKMDFREIWEKIIKYSAIPEKQISISNPSAIDELKADLILFAQGRTMEVDSSLIKPRPKTYSSVEDLFVEHALLEFIAKFDDGSYWAVTEEEDFWHIYRGKA